MQSYINKSYFLYLALLAPHHTHPHTRLNTGLPFLRLKKSIILVCRKGVNLKKNKKSIMMIFKFIFKKFSYENF